MNKVCEEFKLDIMDYASGHRECLPIARQKELVKHIVKCKECRKEFLDNQNIFALISMQSQSTKSKQKMADFIKKLISEGNKKLNSNDEWSIAASPSSKTKKGKKK